MRHDLTPSDTRVADTLVVVLQQRLAANLPELRGEDHELDTAGHAAEVLGDADFGDTQRKVTAPEWIACLDTPFDRTPVSFVDRDGGRRW